MNKRQYFEGFSEEKQKQYEQEIRARYGEKAFEGVTDWNSYTWIGNVIKKVAPLPAALSTSRSPCN